jgi:hypothetical protein
MGMPISLGPFDALCEKCSADERLCFLGCGRPPIRVSGGGHESGQLKVCPAAKHRGLVSRPPSVLVGSAQEMPANRAHEQ